MRNNSALSTTSSCFVLFLLPLGRPGFFFSAVFSTFLASALALLAAFSSATFHNLSDLHWIRLLFPNIHQRKSKKRETGNNLLLNA